MIIVYTLLRQCVIEFINVWGIINDTTHITDYYLLQSLYNYVTVVLKLKYLQTSSSTMFVMELQRCLIFTS